MGSKQVYIRCVTKEGAWSESIWALNDADDEDDDNELLSIIDDGWVISAHQYKYRSDLLPLLLLLLINIVKRFTEQWFSLVHEKLLL